MGRFYNLIKQCQKGNTDSTLYLLNQFTPLLDKFQRNSYDEDMKSELTLFMLKLVHKIPIDREIFKQDAYVVSYITKSLKNQYIYLNKKVSNRIYKELPLDISIYNHYEDDFNQIFFKSMIKNLTICEKNALKQIYLFNYSESDVARLNNVSRQAIHKTHMRALKKLHKYLS